MQVQISLLTKQQILSAFCYNYLYFWFFSHLVARKDSTESFQLTANPEDAINFFGDEHTSREKCLVLCSSGILFLTEI
jgi:hypothetical protein